MKRQEELNEAWCKYMGKCSTEIMQALAFALRWCDKHPNWISVEDELPEENRWVLTYNGTSINLLMLAGNGGWYDHSVVKHLNITHWMPSQHRQWKLGETKGKFPLITSKSSARQTT